MCNFSPVVAFIPRGDHRTRGISGFLLFVVLLSTLFISACVSNPVPHPGVEENTGFRGTAGAGAAQAEADPQVGNDEGPPAGGSLDEDGPTMGEASESEQDGLMQSDSGIDAGHDDTFDSDLFESDGGERENDLGPWPD